MTDKKVNPIGNALGLLRIRVKRGINLAVRDVSSSDPYVFVRLGKQKLKTRIIRKSLNPEWNEDLTLCVTDPNESIKIFVYDHDTFSLDDKMGDAEFDISPVLEAVKLNLEGVPDGTVIKKVRPDRQNCIAEESSIVWKDGKVTQNMFLRLRNVECGEIELQLHWIDLPSTQSL
ncbi:protein C2-DOMAIN ABA-RELATED 4-like [Chenopodium quinoa]|uniref:C2 domain-containing protein n=1 Tax=Chenopodium quinoa TaxID=63459 RepID=A0A803N156_CHEQI|nr:protein C2-DOMAIN ABA-RELATED 4-like [Chenopodium quinoa]